MAYKYYNSNKYCGIRSNKLNEEINKWLKQKSYRAMLTIKFYTTKNPDSCLKELNKLIKNINARCFGSRFELKNLYIDGFAVCEENSGDTVSNFHVHILINNLGVNNKFDLHTFFGFVVKSAEKLFNVSGSRVFPCAEPRVDNLNSDGVTGLNAGCFHIVENYSEDAIDYVMKKMSGEYSHEKIKYLGVRGISDYGTDFITNR